MMKNERCVGNKEKLTIEDRTSMEKLRFINTISIKLCGIQTIKRR